MRRDSWTSLPWWPASRATRRSWSVSWLTSFRDELGPELVEAPGRLLLEDLRRILGAPEGRIEFADNRPVVDPLDPGEELRGRPVAVPVAVPLGVDGGEPGLRL